MKFNRHDEVRGDFDAKSVLSDLNGLGGFSSLSKLANYDYRSKLAVNTLSQQSNGAKPYTNEPFYTNESQSNFFIMKDKDDKLANDLKFKDIFTKAPKIDDKLASKASSTIDDINEESWRYNRKWLSTVFMIWFFLAFALLINAIYY